MQHGCTPRPRHPPPTPPFVRSGLRLALLAAAVATGGGCASAPPPDERPLVVEHPRTHRPVGVSGAVATVDARHEHRRALDEAALSAAFVRARTLVETASGTDLSTVLLQVVDDAAILAEVSVETRRLVRGQLGTGPLAERMLESLMHGQSGTYAALYSGRRRAVMVSREVLRGYLDSLPPSPPARDEARLVLMLHELVHAADDLRHAIHANRTLDFRASFAQSAAFEGHAQWMTRTICRREGCLGGLDALDAFMFAERGDGRESAFDGSAPPGTGSRSTESATGRPSPPDSNLLEYSYVEGERFVAALAAREDGAALVERLLASPPHDPLQILDPDSFPDDARESRNRQLLAIARDVDHPWIVGPGARVPVATSPLKGVDLRDDPVRRAAAIDGFTRLVTAMVAVQLHDPAERARPPVEVTLMRTDTPATARLFADTLHARNRRPGVTATRTPEAGTPDAVRRDALMRTEMPTHEGDTWSTVIASGGHFVVQASGRTTSPAPIDTYVLDVLDALVAAAPASETLRALEPARDTVSTSFRSTRSAS